MVKGLTARKVTSKFVEGVDGCQADCDQVVLVRGKIGHDISFCFEESWYKNV
jgi:hypothetical protein